MRTRSRSLPSGSDAAAIERARREPAAFGVVFDRHYAAVHGFVARRAGGDLADEIAAATFARAFDRRASYDTGHPDARPWLIAIALDLLRRHWRTERRHLATWARAQAGPDAESLPESLAGELVEALDDLRAADREALLLHLWGELSYTEIAAALACPVGTVRSRIARARGRLRRSLRLAVATPVSAVAKESRHA